MLRYFRINDPYRLLALLVLLVIVYLPLFIDPPPLTLPEFRSMLVGERVQDGNTMYADVVDNSGPLAAWFHAAMDFLFGRSLIARHIVAFIIIFLQSAFLGIIFITRKVFNENTFIPSLIFSILFFFSFDTLSFTDELLGSGFLLLALNNLFTEIEFRMPRDETTFNLGFFVSLASLFYLPYVVFLFGIVVILFLFARSDLRKFFLLIFGFALPHLLVLCLHYLNGSLEEVWNQFYRTGISFDRRFLVPSGGLVLLSSIGILYLCISIVMLNRLARFSKYQSQLLQTIFLWIGFCFIFLLFCNDIRPQTLIVFIPPVTFLFTHFLLLIRRRKFAEMNTLILLVGIVAISYSGRYNRIKRIDYSRLAVAPAQNLPDVHDRRILVLGDDKSPYIHNKPATRYLNWELAREVFDNPEFYESVTDVYQTFKKDPPDIVIDTNNSLKPFLDRIPELKRAYVRKGTLYERVVVSN